MDKLFKLLDFFFFNFDETLCESSIIFLILLMYHDFGHSNASWLARANEYYKFLKSPSGKKEINNWKI